MNTKTLYLGLICLLSPFAAHAQSDHNMTWTVSGIEGIAALDLDINIGTQYFTANGGVHSEDGRTLAITGTCFETAQGGVNCIFFVGNGLTVALDLNSLLSGRWSTYNVSGQEVEAGTVTLDSIR